MALLGGLLATMQKRIARTSRPDAGSLWRVTALAVGAYVILVPTAMHPWYVLWVVPFLCLHPSPALLFFSAAVTLGYTQYLVEPQTLPWWAWLAEYGPLYALLVWGWRVGASAGHAVGSHVGGAGALRTPDMTAR